MSSASGPVVLPSLSPMSHRGPSDVLRIAHRGAGAMEKYAPKELLHVAEQGAHLVEFDLHVTGDDYLVARHDPVVSVDGVPTWLADTELVEVLPTLQRAGVSTVEEVVRAARQAGLGLYADVKTMTVAAAERLALLLDSENMINKTILASVRSDIVMRCAPATSGIPWAVLFASILEDPVQLAASIDASYVHPCWERLPRPDQLLAGAWLDRVRAHGLGVITWHEERPAVVQSLYDLGVDGICTDEPMLLTQIASVDRPGLSTPCSDQPGKAQDRDAASTSTAWPGRTFSPRVR